MKQLLFLLLFPCLAMAQYPGNAGQKITLGEQTTADGLVYRGLAADTTRKPSVDTMAFILLDTNTNIIWQYKKATNNAWTRLNLLPSDTTSFNYVNTYGTQTVNGAKTFTSAVTGASFIPTSSTIPTRGMYLHATNTLGFSTNSNTKFLISSGGNLCTDSISKTTVVYKTFELGKGVGTTVLAGRTDGFNSFLLGTNFYYDGGTNLEYIGNGFSSYYSQTNGTHEFFTAPSGNAGANITYTSRFYINNLGDVGIGTPSPAVQFHTTGGVRFAGLASITDLRTDADGDLFNGSDFNLKNSIDTINFGLSDVLKLKPVSFNWNDEQRNINEYKSMGFIAQDVMNIIPNAASTMGDGDMQVDYNAIVATLTKAIQEQQTLIKALEQRIINLENK